MPRLRSPSMIPTEKTVPNRCGRVEYEKYDVDRMGGSARTTGKAQNRGSGNLGAF